MKQETRVFKNINLKINAGEKIVIVGENGSGKTTLLKINAFLSKTFTLVSLR